MPARHDQVTDPAVADALLIARRGTAYFARQLAALSDEDFAAPSLVPGWSRAHIAAHVGYNARALTRLVEWARTGIETPMYAGPAERNLEIEQGATLKPIALRHLVTHAAVHLTVEWRDLPADAWTRIVRTAQGRSVPVSETAWMRSREVWIHAVDLDNGGAFGDFPAPVVDGLLRDITGLWRTRGVGAGLVLRPTDRDTAITITDAGDGAGTVITGTAADLARWASGRGDAGVRTPDGPVPSPPRWL